MSNAAHRGEAAVASPSYPPRCTRQRPSPAAPTPLSHTPGGSRPRARTRIDDRFSWQSSQIQRSFPCQKAGDEKQWRVPSSEDVAKPMGLPAHQVPVAEYPVGPEGL